MNTMDPRRLALRLAIWTALLAQAACYLPYDEMPEPPRNSPAFLSASISIREEATAPAGASRIARVSVNGHFQPGTDNRGNLNSLRDSTLLIAGRRVGLRRQGDPRYSGYSLGESWTASWDALGDSSITFEPPRIEGRTPPFERVRLGVWAPAGPQEVTAPVGGDVRLPLRAPAGAESETGRTQAWQLVAVGPRGSYSISGSGRPPTALRIPAENLPIDGPGRVTGTVSVTQIPATATPPFSGAGGYGVSVSLSTQIAWTIQLTAPPGR